MEIVKNIFKLFWTTIGIENNIFPKWAKFSLFLFPAVCWNVWGIT
uniref:Uncharacterized protein n=1 Tax=Anguilla anguilla TaxID=7936 RepID=A0A0E9VVN8_ANGAN